MVLWIGRSRLGRRGVDAGCGGDIILFTTIVRLRADAGVVFHYPPSCRRPLAGLTLLTILAGSARLLRHRRKE